MCPTSRPGATPYPWGIPATLYATVRDSVGQLDVTWRFPGGTSATGPRVKHTSDEAGDHEVTVVAEDECGARDEQTVTYEARPPAPEDEDAQPGSSNGTDAGGTQVNNVAVIEEGRTYRVRPQNGTGIANFEVEAKIQTFDPECTEEAEGEN